jgi:hypothetical protein
MRRPILLLPLLLAACWPFGGGNTSANDPNALTLCVENGAVGYGNVVARAELTRFDVLPGQTVCKRINPAAARLTLTARTTSGGAAGPLAWSIPLPSTAPGCWRWRLGSSAASGLDLTPCPEDQPRE